MMKHGWDLWNFGDVIFSQFAGIRSWGFLPAWRLESFRSSIDISCNKDVCFAVGSIEKAEMVRDLWGKDIWIA